MDLNWSDLRSVHGSQEKGFDELSSQLARPEAQAGAEFVRKGSPDGGVECFCRLDGSREWGWQVDSACREASRIGRGAPRLCDGQSRGWCLRSA